MKRLIATLLLSAAQAAFADEVILAPADFVRQSVAQEWSAARVLWLDDATQARLRPIFGHDYPAARLRWWQAGDKTAWVLEDIGKEFPITAGFVVRGGAIESAEVLIYRESRGEEIRYPRFLRQFRGARLRDDGLSADIDGISGATLSVAAMRRMARAALVLAQSAH